MIFKTKKIDSSETLAEIFKKLRRETKVSLRELSRLTKIPKKYLTYLEDGDYNYLPADVYVKGYLRACGRFFKKNPKLLIKIYQRERQILRNLEQKKDSRETLKSLKYPRLVITPRNFTCFFVIVILVMVSIYFWYELDLFKGLPQIDLITPQKDLKTSQDFILFSGKVSKQAKLLLNNQAVWMDESGEFRELVPLQEGLNSIYLVAINKLGKEKVIIRHILKQEHL